MKVLVTGATGLIGNALIKALSARGDEITALTRSTSGEGARALALIPNTKVTTWPAPPALAELVGGLDAVINLAGEPIFAGRWTQERRQVIRDSRVHATRLIFDAVRGAARKPSVVISASAVGFYGPHSSDRLTEVDPAGTDFLADVCREWEAAAEPVPEGVRVVRTRIGVVLSNDGGALEQMVRPFKMFGGGPIGDGSQWVSWIHIDDVVDLMLFALDTPKVAGPVNLTAPEPVTNEEISKLIGKAVHRPSWLRVPKFALKLALGELSEIVLTGQRVIPDVALKAGYRFRHPTAQEALTSLLS